MAQLLQRDARMIILKKELIAPSLIPSDSRLEQARHQKGMVLRVGEMGIMMDYQNPGIGTLPRLARCCTIASRWMATSHWRLHWMDTVRRWRSWGLMLSRESPFSGLGALGLMLSRKLRLDALKGQRQRDRDNSSPEASQKIEKVLVEMKASNRWFGSASAGEECWIGCKWMLMQGYQESSSSFEVSASCWRWRRGIYIVIWHRSAYSISLLILRSSL